MMPAVLANAIYNRTPYAPPIPFATFSESNVVWVDFQKRAERLADQAQGCADGGSDWPEWRKIASDRLGRLRRLGNGWDGAGSISISPEVIMKADRVLEFAFDGFAHPAPPATVPCGDGSIQLEWWLVDTRFEISIEANGRLEAWGLDRENRHEAAASDARAIELLRKWASRLTADKLVHQA